MLRLLIVVNGQDHYVTVNDGDTLHHVRNRLLYEFSFGASFDRWELRSEPGTLLDGSELAASFVTQPLYLTAPIGYSG